MKLPGFLFIEDERMPPDTIAFVGGLIELRMLIHPLPEGGAIVAFTPDLVRMAELGRVVILKGFALEAPAS